MPEWYDDHHDELWEYDTPHLEVDVSDNPVIAELYHPDGELLIQVLEREPIGYRIR